MVPPATPNPLSPGHVSAAEPIAEIAEIAEILARGLVRLKARQSRPLSEDRGESAVDFSANQRGHVTPNQHLGDAE
jgi:dissimilatory sulfite reductase (desulfoviridin) alpha/beta subunit